MQNWGIKCNQRCSCEQHFQPISNYQDKIWKHFLMRNCCKPSYLREFFFKLTARIPRNICTSNVGMRTIRIILLTNWTSGKCVPVSITCNSRSLLRAINLQILNKIPTSALFEDMVKIFVFLRTINLPNTPRNISAPYPVLSADYSVYPAPTDVIRRASVRLRPGAS